MMALAMPMTDPFPTIKIIEVRTCNDGVLLGIK